MKKLLLLSFLLMIEISTYGQVNLIPNPSFEDTIACPFAIGQINFAISWDAYRISPDYLNSCNLGQVGVPSNNFGYQYPHSGNAYAGFITYAYFGINAREILGIQLIQPLIIGQRYSVSFYVSKGSSYYHNVAANKIGARFSTVSFNSTSPIPIDNFAHIYTDSVISDSISWSKISGTFIADSAYAYVSFGSFFQDTAVTIMAFDTTSSVAYYYIDDVFVGLDSSKSNNVFHKDNSEGIFLYPNPSPGSFVITGQNLRSFEIFNELGRIIMHGFIDNPNYHLINLKMKGVFYIKIKTNSSYIVKKVIFTN